MQTVQANIQTTRKWAAGWSYMEATQHVADVKLTAPRVTKQGNGYDEGPRTVQYTRIPRGVNATRLATALVHTLSGSSCQHEYDCCGCASYYTRVTKVNKRQLRVNTSVSYNY